MKKQENQFISLVFNIIVPVMILNKGSNILGTTNALLIALAFPISYGIYDFNQRRKMNFISLLGLLNVALTGGLALSGLTGIWFAVKEAAFPALIGCFVLGSAFTKKPFVTTIFLNDQFVKTHLIDEKVSELNIHTDMEKLLKLSTILLSMSFALSAFLNFALAKYIFKPIDPLSLNGAVVLNEQIAQMTSWSFVVIMIPTVTFLAGVFWFFINRLTKLTGIPHTSLFKNN
jgi:hypothetical protein